MDERCSFVQIPNMLLAIDTTGPACSAALFDSGTGRVASEISLDIGRGHAEKLSDLLADLVSHHGGWSAISAVGCTTGPGSFTGLRVGLAMAQGLSLGLSCPMHGISVFDAFFEAFAEGQPLGIVLKAGRGQAWCAAVDGDGRVLLSPQSLPVDEVAGTLSSLLKRVCGSGVEECALGGSFDVLNDLASPPIAAVARAISKYPNGDTTALYLRAPDAKPQKPLLAASGDKVAS